MISEQEYVIQRFSSKFEAFRGKKIVLHGTRNYAEAILTSFDEDYGFVGVMTNDAYEEETFCGKKILKEEDLFVHGVEMIILTERVKYAEAAYQQLCEFCKAYGILLYNMYGLDELKNHEHPAVCYRMNERKMLEKADTYDVVALEAMDTFLISEVTQRTPVVRADGRAFFDHVRSRGIPVYFSLRKSLPADLQIKALEQAKLYPSTEELQKHLIYRQGEDLSFRAFREAFPDKKILYIGTGLVNEYLLPKCYDIDTVCIRTYSIFDGIEQLQKNAAKRIQTPESLLVRGKALYKVVEKEIEQAEVVSFDVFDTLLVRKTLFPKDVFALMEERSLPDGQKVKELVTDFAKVREEAEKETAGGTLEDIYAHIRLKQSLSEECAKALTELELHCEEEVLMPRRRVVEVYRKALNEGKRVVLTSDMYLPEETLKEILKKNGITGYEKLFVSCDYGVGKANGLFQVVQDTLGTTNIVHLGDHEQVDVEMAKAWGLHSVPIPSALQLAMENHWGDALQCAKRFTERKLAGLSVAMAFEDPFAPGAILDLDPEERYVRYSVSCVAPVVLGYLSWLLAEVKKRGLDRILFFARDGYLPYLCYGMLEGKDLPKAVYFYANRHAAMIGAQSGDVDDFYLEKAGNDFALNPEEILLNLCDLDPSVVEAYDGKEAIRSYLNRHTDAIRKRRDQVRAGYATYMKQLGIGEEEKLAAVDFVASGTTQLLLEKFLPNPMVGLYFGNPLYNLTECDHMDYYLQGEPIFLLQNFMEMECFMTSLEPSLNSIEEDGQIVFQKEVRGEKILHAVRKIHARVLDYTKEYLRLYGWNEEVIEAGFVEALYAAEGWHGVIQKTYDDLTKKAFNNEEG